MTVSTMGYGFVYPYLLRKNKYEMDDDYVIRRKDKPKEENINRIVVKRVSNAKDLANMVRIQEALWDEDDWDEEMHMINYDLSPSYIIQSESGNTIFGYMTTRLVPIDEDGDVDDDIYFEDDIEVVKYMEKGYKIAIAFEDLYTASSLTIYKAGKVMADHVIEFIKSNGIKYSTANTNSFSKGLDDKLLSGVTEYIEDKYFSKYVDAFDDEDGKPPKLPKGLLANKVQIEYDF